MAIIVSYNAFLSVNGVDFSNHCLQLTVNDGQESKEVTAMGDTSKRFRAGLGTFSVEATLWSDVSSGSVVDTLRPLITMTSTGFEVAVKKDTGTVTVNNPRFTFQAIVDGDVNLLDEKPGEVSQLKVKFLPYSAPVITTTSS
jgi:hypothetical protein